MVSIKRAFLRFVLVVVGAVALSAAAAGRARGEPPAASASAATEAPAEKLAWKNWRPPARTPYRLVENEAEIVARPRKIRRLGVTRWTGESLARDWKLKGYDDRVELSCSSLPSESSQYEQLVVRLVPGNTDRMLVHALVEETSAELSEWSERIGARTVKLPIDAGGARETALEISIPVRELVDGSWHDAKRERKVEGLRLVFSSPSAPFARVTEIRLEEVAALMGNSPAISARFELGGTTRPAWALRAGTVARFTVNVPRERPRLRWHDGRLGDAGARVVRVKRWLLSTELARVESASSRDNWTAHEVTLDAWAGKKITLEVETATGGEGSGGIGLFGDPVVVTSSRDLRTPNVLVYLIDTLRADRIGAWGHSDARTPVMDRLAREGWSFRRAVSPGSWTKPVIPSLMTGIEPPTHRVGALSYGDALPETVPLLQQAYRDAGWRTGSFTANPLGSNLSALERGFGEAALPRHWRGRTGDFGHATAAQLHEAFLSFIDAEPNRPYFAYVHTLEPHEYHRPFFRQKGMNDQRAYDEAVAAADRQLGRLVQRLEKRGRLENLLLVLVSDHGESIGEHGIIRGHGESLFQSEIHVPLVLWSPGGLPAKKVDETVTLTDLPATLLELSGLSPLPATDSRSLVPVLEEKLPARETVFSSSLLRILRPEAPKIFAAVSREGRKLFRVIGVRDLSYDLRRDPQEVRPLEAAPGDLVSQLDLWLRDQERAAETFRRQHSHVVRPVEMDTDDVERLKSLGYVD